MSSETFELDVLGQQSGMHKLYTQLSFIYEMPDPKARNTMIDTLEKGLNKLSLALPWLAGEVIQEDVSEESTGTFKVKFNRSTGKIPLVVKNLIDDPSAPTMKALKESNFPMSMLDENVIAPCLTLNLPGNTIGLAAHSTPVIAVQANFIKGGLILTIAAEHNVMDMTGLDVIIGWLSKACHENPLPEAVEKVGNMDRTLAVPMVLNDDNDRITGHELDDQLRKPRIADSEVTNPDTQPHSKWAYFTFSDESLKDLKDQATRDLPSSSNFVSTDDTLCAFIWRCISRVRMSRLEPSKISVFARAVDAREAMFLPSTYTGLFQTMTYQRFTIGQLAKQSLGSTAAEFRRQLDPNIENSVKNRFCALATYIRENKDRSKINFTASVESPSGIALSSWAKIAGYDFDFNLGLGKPESVRRPMFMPVESLLYFMPRNLDGEMAVAACFRIEDWERLRSDKEFMKAATYIG